jgi:putative nucleotidyltransferase with HDIG domain
MTSTGRTPRAIRWERRWLAGLALRAVSTVVPFVLAVGVIAAGSRLLPRPTGTAVVGWYAGICAASTLVLWLSHRVLERLLPLAGLLEMSLLFPDTAPSRLRLARRVASKKDLADLLAGQHVPHRAESTQQAAERILALVGALSAHDRSTRGHSERVRVLSDLIATRMGLSERDRDRLRWAALLHDIGKLQVPAALLNKPATPSTAEWTILRTHPQHGAQIAEPLMEWLDGWGDVIVQHHEKWDGSGYPAGLSGKQICLGARIVAVADAFDVMTAARAYKKPSGRAAALRELVACSGAHFDPEVVRALITTPARRMLLTMGPLSWLTGLPFVGQAPMALTGTLASQAAAAAGAIALTGTAAISPLMFPAAASVQADPGHSGLQHHSATAQARFPTRPRASVGETSAAGPRTPSAPAEQSRLTAHVSLTAAPTTAPSLDAAAAQPSSPRVEPTSTDSAGRSSSQTATTTTTTSEKTSSSSTTPSDTTSNRGRKGRRWWGGSGQTGRGGHGSTTAKGSSDAADGTHA